MTDFLVPIYFLTLLPPRDYTLLDYIANPFTAHQNLTVSGVRIPRPSASASPLSARAAIRPRRATLPTGSLPPANLRVDTPAAFTTSDLVAQRRLQGRHHHALHPRLHHRPGPGRDRDHGEDQERSLRPALGRLDPQDRRRQRLRDVLQSKVDKKYSYKGKRVSVLTAKCPDGKLQAKERRFSPIGPRPQPNSSAPARARAEPKPSLRYRQEARRAAERPPFCLPDSAATESLPPNRSDGRRAPRRGRRGA